MSTTVRNSRLDNELNNNSQVHRAEILLGLTRKAASTTADQAYNPANLLKREVDWSQPPPLGVHRVPAWDMIDVDEARFKLEHQNRKFGKIVPRLRCDQAGVYGIGSKMNLLLAITGDPVLAMRWWKMWRKGRTTLDCFANFMQVVLDGLAANPQIAGQTFTFTRNNLNVHKHPLILNMIRGAGHRLMFRARYWPVGGAVEYVFDTIQTHISRLLIS